MFKVATKNDLCHVSLTGLRALVLVGLLIKAPLSLEEIRHAFLEYNLIEESNSDDIIRIDLNTLRVTGCEITRAGFSTNFKYKLTKHPFALKFTEDEVNVIRRAYRKIKDSASVETLILYDNLFRKIADNIENDEIKEMFYGISALKSYKLDVIEGLLEDCKAGRILIIQYKSPTSIKESLKEIIAKKVIFKNDKVYLLGYEPEKDRTVTLNVRRIENVVSKKEDKRNLCDIQPVRVSFLLNKYCAIPLNDKETKKILQEDDRYLVEGFYYNEFVAIQRILSFGADCTVLEPLDIRVKVIEYLKSMREVYHE